MWLIGQNASELHQKWLGDAGEESVTSNRPPTRIHVLPTQSLLETLADVWASHVAPLAESGIMQIGGSGLPRENYKFYFPSPKSFFQNQSNTVSGHHQWVFFWHYAGSDTM